VRDQFNPFVKSFCKRDPGLEETFQSFNAKYFRGNLPRYQVLICTKSKNFSHVGAGYCSTSDRKIYIRSGISTNATSQTLAHEMVHAKLWWIKKSVHGRSFVRELKRIRKLGAPLSKSELDIARPDDFFQAPKLTKRNIEATILIGLNEEKLPPGLLPKFLEREFYLPYVVINKVTNIQELISRAKKSSPLFQEIDRPRR